MDIQDKTNPIKIPARFFCRYRQDYPQMCTEWQSTIIAKTMLKRSTKWGTQVSPTPTPVCAMPMDNSPPGSPVHGILQARILEWVVMPSSKGSSQSRDQTQVSHIAGGFFTSWATREAQEYWSGWPAPSPGDLPNPGIEPRSPSIAGRLFPSWATREAMVIKLAVLVEGTDAQINRTKQKTQKETHTNVSRWFLTNV